MAISQNHNPNLQNPNQEEDVEEVGELELELDDDNDDDDDEEDDEDVDVETFEERLIEKIKGRPIGLRIHELVIKGNTRTKTSFIESYYASLHAATMLREIYDTITAANSRLQSLDIFDSVSVLLDAGPPHHQGTASVFVDVVEARNPIVGQFALFSKPQTRSFSFEGLLKFKNLSGYGDVWDASGAFGWDKYSELSAGLTLPRFMALPTPVVGRLSLLSEDWLKFSSYKERLLDLTVGLISTEHHDLACNLTWSALSDPSHKSSKSISRQLGHYLLSSMKYTYKMDHRDSSMRPTRGYAFSSVSKIGGLGPGNSSRFVRQEFDVRFALPFGFYNAALNFGVSAGVILPQGDGFRSISSSLSERFFVGGHSSPVCTMSGPTVLLGFKSRGFSPTDYQRFTTDKSNIDDSTASPNQNIVGDIAATAFADLSFDLPLKLLRDIGIHGHMFICGGNLAQLTENEFRNFSLKKFVNSFRSSAGFGMVIPIKLFRMEINYCYILKHFAQDHCRNGVQFSFSSPR